MDIAGRIIGPEHPPFIIAEMSANHGGDIERAKAIITMARECGADAVKMQSYTPDTITIDHDGPEFRIESGLWAGETLYSLYQKAHTPFEWHEELFAHAAEEGITLFSAPFDPTAVDLLESLNAPAYKIASLELVDIPLIEKVARAGKPLILSTGTASLEDIKRAIDAAISQGNENIILLHCVSGYPTPMKEVHLRTMEDLKQQFSVPVGLSDHSLGLAVPIAATALGACVIEKHVTLRRADGGADAAFSLEPEELASLVKETCNAFQALGSVSYELKPSEKTNASFKRSLYVVQDVAKNEELTEDNIRSIRPGYGLAPRHFKEVLGKRAKAPISKGTALNWDLFQ